MLPTEPGILDFESDDESPACYGGVDLVDGEWSEEEPVYRSCVVVPPSFIASMPRASPRRYAGFVEHAYRLLFAYADAFPDLKPELLTILPSGVVENRKVLEPKQGKGLLAYPYIQTIAPTLATEHLETPWVREREDGSLALVQAWSTNYNDSFREQYDIHKENPDTSIFSLQAAQEFTTAIAELFGPAADDSSAPPVLYCHRASKNDSAVFLATTEELLAFLEGNPQEMVKMGVLSLSKDGFVTRVFGNDGAEKGTKAFTMARGERYALYTKKGYETMACVTPEDQFKKDRDLLDDEW